MRGHLPWLYAAYRKDMEGRDITNQNAEQTLFEDSVWKSYNLCNLILVGSFGSFGTFGMDG